MEIGYAWILDILQLLTNKISDKVFSEISVFPGTTQKQPERQLGHFTQIMCACASYWQTFYTFVDQMLFLSAAIVTWVIFAFNNLKLNYKEKKYMNKRAANRQIVSLMVSTPPSTYIGIAATQAVLMLLSQPGEM